MATGQPSGVIQHLRRAMLLRDGAGLTDGQLLEDYISRRDKAALAALVQRHGPMVWGVCRRVLGNYHDAEDAFQAAFLVLVRRAASIASPELLANWLYGVAHQTAMKARATLAKRKVRERQVTEMPEPAVVEQDLWNDLQPLLDQELSRLPDIHRVVIVLCDLEGKTRKEAAGHLGLREGTVGSRLARARVMLARRLAQRGVTLSCGALAAVLAQNVASAGVPNSVVSATIQAATLVAAGQAAATGVISVKVATLTEGVLKSMLMSKLKAVTAVFLVVGMIASGGGMLTYQIATAQQVRSAEIKKGQGEEAKKSEEQRKLEQAEMAALEGTWSNVYTEIDEKKQPAWKRYEWTFKDGKAELRCEREANGDDQGFKSPEPPVQLTLTVDPSKSPKEITMSNEGGAKILFHIYKLEKDTLTLVYFGGAAARPKGFTLKDAGDLSAGVLVLEVYERKRIPKAGADAKQEKEGFTAWGKEVGGLQAGLGYDPGQKRSYRLGETVRLVLRVRNVRKEAVKFEYHRTFFMEYPPAVTDGQGKRVRLTRVALSRELPPEQANLAPGKEIELYELNFKLRPASEKGVDTLDDVDFAGRVSTLYGTGKFQIQYERFIGKSSADPTLSKLATGKLELEIKSDPPPAATEKQTKPVDKPAEKPKEDLLPRGPYTTEPKGADKVPQKEGITAWGKEIGGLQAGLGYRPGQKRAYSHGETVKLVVRVRNVGKEEVTFQYLDQFFVENPPAVTDGQGKPVRLPGITALGIHIPVDAYLAPEKEMELYELNFKLRPARKNGDDKLTDADRPSTLYGTGKFQIQYGRVLGGSSSGTIMLDPRLTKLATGKLELEIKAEEPVKTPPKDLGKIQPPGGEPLPLVKPGTNSIGVDQLNKVRKRLEAVPKEDLEKWVVELERIMDKKLKDGVPSARQVCRTDFVIHLSVAFDDLKWNAKTADNLFQRAQTMPASEAKVWKEAFEALLKKEIGQTDITNYAGGPAWAVPLVLIPVEALHEGQKYSAERGKKYLARMKQLTADDVSLWKDKVDEFGGTQLDAAVNIILLDDFFDKEKFQRDKFKAAIGARKK